MRAQLAQLRHRWRQIPTRARMGVVVAVVAIAGLAWQHYSGEPVAPPAQQEQTSADQGGINHDGHDHGEDGHAHGEYQPDPSQLPPPPDFSPEAARATAERFATNFASPNGNREDWLARVTPDVMPELADQYRLTDIRNLPQAAVTQVSGPLTGDAAAPTFQVDYSDGSRVETTLEMDITGWKVSTVVPVSTPADPAGPAPAAEPVAPTPPAAEPVAPAPPPVADPTTAPIPGTIPIGHPATP